MINTNTAHRLAFRSGWLGTHAVMGRPRSVCDAIGRTAIAAFAALVLGASSAAHGQTALIIEAESMASRDFGAHLYDGWVLWRNGVVEDTIEIAEDGEYKVEVVALGERAYGIDALMELRIDDEPIERRFVNPGDYQSYLFDAFIAAGEHKITVAFLNDVYDASADIDRNLGIDKIILRSARFDDDPPLYGSRGNGSPMADQCETTLSGNLQSALQQVEVDVPICIAAGDYTSEGVIVIDRDFLALHADGRVELKGVDIRADDVTVNGFRFTDTDTSSGYLVAAIRFEGSRADIQNNYIAGAAVYKGIACGDRVDCNDARIISNTVTGIESIGIEIFGARHNVLRNNIYGLRRSSPNYDVDAVRFFGVDHLIRENYIHDINEFQSVRDEDDDTPHVDCFQTFTMFESYNPPTNAIETSRVLIENNYCVRVSRQCLIMENNRVDETVTHGITFRNNVCEVYDSQVVNLKGLDDIRIENNYLGGNPKYQVVRLQRSGVSGARPMRRLSLRNNVMQRGTDDVKAVNSEDVAQDSQFDHNIVVTQPTTITRSSSFQETVNATYAAIQASDFSEFYQVIGAIDVEDAGTILDDYSYDDLAGQQRIMGSQIDIGPYEYQ